MPLRERRMKDYPTVEPTRHDLAGGPEPPKYRDAVSGEYVTEEYAKANPATTVREQS